MDKNREGGRMIDKLHTPSQNTSSNDKEEKNIQENLPSSLPQDHEKKGGGFLATVVRIDEKIQLLKKKKEKIQNQQALLFMKEAQKIFKEEFSPSMALKLLKDHWNGASKTQKAEWKKRAELFLSSTSKTLKKTEKHNPAPEQSGKAETPHNDHT